MKGWWLTLGVGFGLAVLLAWIRRRQEANDRPDLCDRMRKVWPTTDTTRKIA